MNLFKQLLTAIPGVRIELSGTRASERLPFLTGATGKKIEETRELLRSLEEKEEAVWNTILRNWGPR